MAASIHTVGLLPTPAGKTSSPDVDGLAVRRPRLMGLIEDSPAEVTLIQAAAGYGKTVLAAGWAAEQDSPVAWVTVDATDNDPVVLISTLLDAFTRAGFAGRWGRVPLTGDEPDYSRHVLPHFRILMETQTDPVTAVIDDVHELEQPAALALLRATVDSLPAGSRVILIGRSLASLPVTQWLSEDRALLLTDADLAMDAAETAGLLGALGSRTGGPHDVDELWSATGGWPIAVYLAVRSGDASRLVEQSHIQSFLDDEVLRHADAETVDFLTKTSPLEGLSGEFCDHVLQRKGSGRLLAAAERSSLLISRGRDLEWYRLHPLLRDHLRRRLMADDPEAARAVVHRACSWSREAGFLDQAITYARESGDLELLGDTVFDGATEALLAGQAQRVFSWLSADDDRDIAASRGLSLTAAWASLNVGRAADTYRWGQTAIANMGDDWQGNLGRSPVAAGAALLLAVNGALGYAASAQLASEALRELPAEHPLRPFAQMVSGWMNALAGDRSIGIQDLQGAALLARARGFPASEVEAHCLLATVLLSQGIYSEAAPLVEVSLDAWERSAISHSRATQALLIGPATLCAAWAGDAALARARLLQCQEVVETFGQVLPWLAVVLEACAAMACVHLADVELAGEHVRRADEFAEAVAGSPLLGDLLTAGREAVAAGSRLSALSPAERRVWDLLQTRATLREIADQLFVSSETVKTQTGSIYRKLGIASRREAQEMGDRLRLRSPARP